ncbi:PTS mannose transporter subunit IIA [Collinsella sp. i05-0019-G5]|uniref:PTS sugar transporter subunit IIA n=1 Tax=Collinsella TaxID=102106 RepID=UPI001EDE359F|nr:PTS fructose transporter subunit IIA [Collinsella aerofaciens]MCG4807488.1 PTS fructose transporter subunit IIA [Collinsella aerofaciens]MCG4816752.1 PTS fructose transporter subunit IIA [Collinsella aerofaciens]
MRQFIIASHAHFAAGINESISLLSGERDNVRTLSMYVDGNNDLAAVAAKMLDETPEGDDLVVCTDLFGGSVNNEFTSIVQRRPNTYLVTNMNLPLLIQLLFAEEGRDTAEVIREICAADDTRVKFVNDLIEDAEDDDEF